MGRKPDLWCAQQDTIARTDVLAANILLRLMVDMDFVLLPRTLDRLKAKLRLIQFSAFRLFCLFPVAPFYASTNDWDLPESTMGALRVEGFRIFKCSSPKNGV